MSIYALIPLVATIAYIPLIVVAVSTRPWRRQHELFFLFLVAASLWSLSDFIFRSHFFPQLSDILLKVILIMFTWMAIQFHCFTSSYFPARKSRWLPFAYGSLLVVIVLAFLGYLSQGVETNGEMLYPRYTYGVFIIGIPLLVLLFRNVYVLWPRLKGGENPVVYNQSIALLLTLSVLTLFSITAILPVGREIPISHIGNIINALILSFAVVGNQLVDVRFVLRRGLVWLIVAVIGLASFWSLLLAFHALFGIELELGSMFASSLAALLVAILVYRLINFISRVMGKAFQGQTYYYRQKLVDFANQIHNIFSLKEQGGELLALVTRAVGCKKAGLMFLDAGSEDFNMLLVEPSGADNSLSLMRLRKDNPIVEYLKREKHPLTKENLFIQSEFLGLWQQEKESIEINEIELFMPLISREKLIGILVLDKKKLGRYTLEDFRLLEDVTHRVAVSMEKEILREQLKEREEELSIINRSSTIITSSLDIQRIYDNFIKELKKVVDVDWAAIAVIEEAEIYFMAISSEIGSPWKVGERIPLKGTATEWVTAHRKALVETDISSEMRFTTDKYFTQHNIRSIAYLPLMISNEVIGTLIMASRTPNDYGQRHLKLLEQLSAQIAMPIENARLYARTERMARIDELTGLLNRRSLDEVLLSEIGRHSRYGGVFSLVIIDLDSFKTFNDSYGHLAGDELLRRIGSTMKNTIREADQAFRYGGDEFAILLPQTSTTDAFAVSERVRQQVHSRVNINSISITISSGIASWPADGVKPNDIIAAADSALYQAKRSGGNCSIVSSAILAPLGKLLPNTPEDQDSGVLSTIFALAATVDARDHYTRSHSKKVHEYAIAIAEGLGLGPLEINRLGTCALLHDIGKIGISDEILNKENCLSENEWEAIKTHSRLGAAIASHSSQLAPCISGILHHHEKYDGGGYPDGLKGDDIPLESRILAIADSFAAMTSPRAYSQPISFEAAIEELKKGAGSHFDPKLVEVFLEVIPPTIAPLNKASIGSEKI